MDSAGHVEEQCVGRARAGGDRQLVVLPFSTAHTEDRRSVGRGSQ